MPDEAAMNETSIAGIRCQLKEWEKKFSGANGRKPGRDDIKNDATMLAKYKEYELLRKNAFKAQAKLRKSGNPERIEEDSKALRERPSNVISVTPRKESKTLELVEQEDKPATTQEQTPASIRMALGPTPQKDGEILSIFDVLSTATPSKGSAMMEQVVGATPSKPAARASSEPTLSRTPQSAGKRFYLGAFAHTPLKRKRDDDVYTPSTAKRQYATPSFLQRILPRVDEDCSEASFAAQPFKKRGLIRSLSTIIQDLRKQEEQRLDEEWEVLQELEAEERGETEQHNVSKVLVEESQATEMPLGPDQGAESNDEAEEVDAGALDANGKPRKVWKKKGLKRQTRRVIMRPNFHKPKAATDVLSADSEGIDEAIEETQAERVGTVLAEDGTDDETLPSEGDANDPAYKQSTEPSHLPPADKHSKKNKSGAKDGKQGTVGSADASKRRKKVNALAHTNFRKLKIKNKNSKANGRGRKFGRR